MVTFLSGPHNRLGGHPHVVCHGDFSIVETKLSSLSLQGFRQRAVLVLSGSKLEGWGKNGKGSLGGL